MPENYEKYEIYGVDPSYFTQKVLAFFAYKQIPFSYIHKTFDKAEMIEKNAGTKLIPVVKMPDDSWGHDSTPLAFEMDRRFPERQLLPDDGALAFVVRLIEDYFDEWLTRQAVHFRWHYAADRRVGGGGIVRNVMGLGVDDDIAEPLKGAYEQVYGRIEKWALKTCDNIAAGAEYKTAVEAEFLRVMGALNDHFKGSDFILGGRPCLADFAIYGGLKAHFINDPTPQALLEKHCPNVLEYATRVEGSFAAGEVENWPEPDAKLPATLLGLLAEISGNFHTFMAANKVAIKAGAANVTCELEGFGTCTIVSRKYTEQCRLELVDKLAKLSQEQQRKLDAWLGDTNVLDVYKDA